MAKARPSRKASPKSGGKASKRSAGSGSAQKHASAKHPSRTPTVRSRGKGVAPGGHKPTGAAPKLSDRKVAIPETPPPLPSPIASFTF